MTVGHLIPVSTSGVRYVMLVLMYIVLYNEIFCDSIFIFTQAINFCFVNRNFDDYVARYLYMMLLL